MSLEHDREELRQRWYDEGFFERTTFADHLAAGAERYPNAAMHFVGGPTPTSITLGELHARSRQVAAGLAGLGVGADDVVAIWVPNWLEGALTYQAALALGTTVVPIIHIYGPREVSYILRDSGPACWSCPTVGARSTTWSDSTRSISGPRSSTSP